MSKKSWLQWLKSKEVPFNIDHPDYKDKVEFMFECDGEKYYKFKEEYEIPTGRYIHIDACLREHEMRMSLPLLKAFIEELKANTNGKTGQIDLHAVNVILYNIETRVNLAFDPDTIKRLASVIYFDKSERLNGFDKDHAAKKIASWEKQKFTDFFFKTPIRELLGLQDISETSLLNYMEEAKQVLQDLNFAPSMSSSPTT